MKKRIKSVLRSVKSHLIHRGNNRECPICKNGSKAFLPCGVVPRADAQCPFCRSLERHRLLWLYIERKTGFLNKPPRSALHVAPEGILENKFRPLFGKGYITADLFAKDVDVKMDITNIQFPDNSFEFVYCSHVLEHVPDDRKAMREFRRVLSTDGVAILLVPITVEKTVEDPTVEDPKERLRLFGQEDHVRNYGPDYVDRLIEAGFTVAKIRPADFLDSTEIQKMAITPAAGDIYICKK